MERLYHHHVSFKNAAAGLWWAIKTQPNFRIHLTLAILALLGGIYFSIPRLEMIIIVFAICFGLGAEMINTALEAMTDLITTEWKKDAKIAKDVSAGMMLVAAIGTFIIALLIFLPKISERFF